MLDRTRTVRSQYENVLRAIGNYLDDQGLSNFSIMETPDGFLIKGRVLVDALDRDYYSAPQAHLFTNEEIEDLIRSAQERRQDTTSEESAQA